MKRRAFINAAIAAGGFAGITSSLNSCANKDSGVTTKASDRKIKIGFIPLTASAPVVMVHELGMYKKHGLDVEVSREASWATIRDKVPSGDLDGAHCLFGMPFTVHTGVGGIAGQEMLIAMILNNNGQAITLSKDFCGKAGFREIGKVKSDGGALKGTKTMPSAISFA